MEQPEINRVEYKLHRAQYDFYNDASLVSLFVGGVGSGKTYVGARKAVNKAIAHPRALGLIAANTQAQLVQSTLVEVWTALAELGFLEGEDYVVNKKPPEDWQVKSRFSRHNGVISLYTGGQLVMRSLTNWKPILGLTLGWAWIDEARDASKEAFNAVLSRLRCKKVKKRQLFLTTTPCGFDWLYEFFEKEPVRDPKLAKQRRYHVAATADNAANLPAEYLEILLSAYDERLAKQELEGRWIDIHTGRAYYAFDHETHISELATYDKHQPVWLCCDFNVTPMTWLIAQKRRRGFGPCSATFQDEVLVVVDQIVIETSNTEEAAREYLSRGYDPQNTVVFGDAAGHHSTTLSDYAAIRRAGIRDVRVPKANPQVLDRVASVNAKLKNANGELGLLIHPQCSALIEDLTRVGFKPGTRQIDKSNLKLTHASDAIGYCVIANWPAHRPGRLRVRGERY
jgi:phage terminase large subunit